MSFRHYLYVLCSCFMFHMGHGSDRIDLAGAWGFQLDPSDIGIEEQWFAKTLEDSIQLPGTTTTANKGESHEVELNLKAETLKRLLQKNSYVGAAWYQIEVDLDEDWLTPGTRMHMERILWESRLWVNGHPVGREQRLSTPHEYVIGVYLKPGVNRITVRVDNRELLPIGIGHAYTEETQTLWNGILGDILLEKGSVLDITRVRLTPNIAEHSVTAQISLSNRSDKTEEAELQIEVLSANFEGTKPSVVRQHVILPKGASVHTVVYEMGQDYQLWSEFNPRLYQMDVALNAGGKQRSAYASRFGMRSIESEGNEIRINGDRVFLRGNLDCAVFPKTGHPDVEGSEWRRIMGIAKEYGLNHIRFHSWTPPEAAFEAADELGMYLQVELPNWSFKNGQLPEVDAFFRREGVNILETYGNHPSLVMLSMGNELTGDYVYLDSVIDQLRSIHPSILYTSTTYSFSPRGASPGPQDDYFVSQETEGGWVRGQGFLNSTPPNTDSDYSEGLSTVGIPLITHEVGQYVVYPDLSDIEQYTDGVMRNIAYESIAKDLREKGRLDEAQKYTAASGKLAAILYKEDMERALRTPGLSGIQLLQLQDFPGQSTACVGLLDPFWESKGILDAEEFREFCSSTVPLLKLPKRVYTSDETLQAEAIIAHFADHALGQGKALWKVSHQSDVIASGEWTFDECPIGNAFEIGEFAVPLAQVTTAAVLEIEIRLPAVGASNHWKVWVYPHETNARDETGAVRVVREWNQQTLEWLNKGENVLLLPPRNTILKPIDGRFIPVFWSPVHFSNQPGTLGALIDNKHSVFAHFPTDFHTDWQWWDLLKDSVSIDLSEVEARLTMPFRFVDKFNRNALPSALFEAKVGHGQLLVCSLDIENNLHDRPVASQLRKSILHYMNSGAFAPEERLKTEELDALLGQPKLLAKTNSQHPDYPARNGVDGNVDTIWHSDWNHRHGPPFFFQVTFPEQRTVIGYEYVPRQDGVNGLVKTFQIESSIDGETWSPVTEKNDFPDGSESLSQTFEKAFQARHLRLMVFSEQQGNEMASLAEFRPIFEGESPSSTDVRDLGIIPGFNDN